MRPGLLARSALRAVVRYQSAGPERRRRGCCRFSPTCSHYAADALRLRTLPVALMLIAWRLLRCTPVTPRGTVDVVRPRGAGWGRRVAAVLMLSGLTTVFAAATASAVSTFPAAGGTSLTAGGCDAFVGGQPIGALTSDHPLAVHKGQRVVVTGLAPAALRGLPTTRAAHATTDIDINFIENVARTSLTEQSTGAKWQRAVNVDSYLKYGSGLYRVDVHSVAPGGWDCTGDFYVQLHGSKLAAEAAIAVGALGIAAVATAGGGGGPPDAADSGLDPSITPEQLDANNAAQRPLDPTKDPTANLSAMTGAGCLILVLVYLTTDLFHNALGAVPVVSAGAAGRGRRRVWVRGRPVRGFFGGLFAGLGGAVALQQFGRSPLTITTAIALPLVCAVIGGLRGWRGTAWRVG